MMNTDSMIVPLKDTHFKSLEYYVGTNGADRVYALKEDVEKYLSAFLSAEELNLLQSKHCNYLVIFEREKLNKGIAQLVK